MVIQVEFFGPIKRPWSEHRRKIQVKRGSTVSMVMRGLGYSSEHLRTLVFTINGSRVNLEQVLTDNDELTLVLLAGGG